MLETHFQQVNGERPTVNRQRRDFANSYRENTLTKSAERRFAAPTLWVVSPLLPAQSAALSGTPQRSTLTGQQPTRRTLPTLATGSPSDANVPWFQIAAARSILTDARLVVECSRQYRRYERPTLIE